MNQIHMDERDLAHIMSVNIGAAYTFVADAAKRLKIEVKQLPVIETIYPELPARAFSIDEKDLCSLIKMFSMTRHETSNLKEMLQYLSYSDGQHRIWYHAGNVLRLSKPLNCPFVFKQ